MNPTLARRSERGMSLIAMLVIVVIVGGISAAFFLLSLTQRQQSDLVQYRTKSYYIGEAAIEMVAGMLKKAAAGGILPANPVINSTSNPPWDTGLNGGTGAPFSLLGLTSQWEWWYLPSTVGAVWKLPSTTEQGTAVASANPACVQLRLHGTVVVNDGIAPETFTYAIANFQNTTGGGVGNTAVKNFYSVTVDGRILHFETAGSKALGSRGTHVKITREMELNNQSLLPFFAFYNGDLEFLPGPKFVGNGKIHTNSDLYLAGAGGLDMNSDYIGASGFMYRHRKDNGSYTQNSAEVTIHPPFAGTPPFGAVNGTGAAWAQTLESGVISPGPPVTEAPNPSWAAGVAAAGLLPTVQSGASRMDTPPIGSIQPPPASGGPGGNYYEWANNPSASGGSVASGLIIAVDSSGTVKATYNNGSGPVDVTSTLQSSGAITSSTIADNRQSQTTAAQTTVIDMGKLRSSGYLPSGGILYTTDARNGLPTRDTSGNLVAPVPPTGTPPAGFVFQNGKDLSTNTNPNVDAINIV
ncbi:MAG TPA: type II secretion system protein, partial [Planctomycetota bacterium]|nr:type II secretion system protein [Planctomycetota bacterium]